MIGRDDDAAGGLGRNILLAVKPHEPKRLADQIGKQPHSGDGDLRRISVGCWLGHKKGRRLAPTYQIRVNT